MLMDSDWRYPLGDHAPQRVRARTSKPLAELTMANVRAGLLCAEDLAIHPETLRAQATIAEQAGFGRLATNLRRAAELALVPDDKVLAIYEALRPYRVTHSQLMALADELEKDYQAPENAALLREAAGVYLARGWV